MKWSDRIYFTLHFAINGALLLYMWQCSPREAAPTTVHTETIRIYDSTPRIITPPAAPGTVSFYPVTGASTILVQADTALLRRYAEQFLAAHVYTQQVRDTAVAITIRDSITQNRIAGRQVSYQLLQPIRTVHSSTVFTQQNRAGLYLGGFLNLQLGTGFSAGPRLSFQTGKNLVLSYDIDPFVKPGPAHRVGVQQRLQW